MKKKKGTWMSIVGMWVIVFIATCVLIKVEGHTDVVNILRTFVAMFFLTFSIPKIMHLSGFAETFARYDLGARSFMPYAYAYPFIELALGFGYLFDYNPLVLNSLTLFIMTFTGFGVVIALHEGRRLRSASMGTIFTMPLGLITLMENAVMAGIATTLLWWL